MIGWQHVMTIYSCYQPTPRWQVPCIRCHHAKIFDLLCPLQLQISTPGLWHVVPCILSPLCCWFNTQTFQPISCQMLGGQNSARKLDTIRWQYIFKLNSIFDCWYFQWFDWFQKILKHPLGASEAPRALAFKSVLKFHIVTQ